MKKVVVLAVGFAMLVVSSFAQTVFTYGTYGVTKNEFVTAFNKNPVAASDRKKSLREYLNLYINFKLKVQAAYDVGLDKDPTQQFELQNFKKQIADNIINDEANVKALVQQAFERSQKEIHLQQVFVEVPPNGDTIEAYKKIQAAYKHLKEGKNFGAVAQELAGDEAAKQSQGDLGFITVFTLPYEIETTVYNLKLNSFSNPVKTIAGYHIFKNAGERKSSGTRRVTQILIATPPDATGEEKNSAARKADSLYNLLKSGAPFGSLAATASNDVSSNNNEGNLPEFSIGTYDAIFENAAFSLKDIGEISKPFQTAFGFHILKLIEAKSVAGDINDPATFATLQEKVIKDNRLELAKKELIQKKLALIKYKPALVESEDLYAFTDGNLRNIAVPRKGIRATTPIFSFAKQQVNAADWVNFVKNSGSTFSTTSKERYQELYKEYIGKAADEYYRNHLDEYNSDFLKQVKEFKEANLLFAIMEKNVWGKANMDTPGLVQYYNQHKTKYTWKPSADVIIVTCSRESLAKELQQKLKGSANDWRQVTSSHGTDVAADSGRYELEQLTVTDRTNFSVGSVTGAVKNPNDGSYSFNYIIKIYNEPTQRSFNDARGLVTSDYQEVLEKEWISSLKKKYPVKVNEAVFQSIK